MKGKRGLSPLATAKKFIDDLFPDCDAALLAGSVTRGGSNRNLRFGYGGLYKRYSLSIQRVIGRIWVAN